MLQTIISAIQNRQEVSFTYDGIDRIALPAAVGVSRTGKDVLRCYQTQGGHINPGHKWDLCTLAKITNLQLTGKTFENNPPEYKRGDKGMLKRYAQL